MTNATCAVKGCGNYYYKTREMLYESYPITYHFFPREIRRAARWYKAAALPVNNVTNSLFVCSIHFKRDDFIMVGGNKRLLRRCAYPTENLRLGQMRETGCVTKKNSTECPDEPSHVPVLVISDDEEEKEIAGNENTHSDFTLRKEINLIHKKYEQLLSAYKEFETDSKAEIERLHFEIKHKDEKCSKKLRQILTEFLSEAEIEFAMFLRKRKKELASRTSKNLLKE